MSRQQFVQNIRWAASLVSPNVQTTSPKLDQSKIQKIFSGATLWLTPKAVEGFDPGDYSELSPSDLAELQSAVAKFHLVASQVPPDAPATKEQIREAAEALKKILPYVRDLETQKLADEIGRIQFPDFVQGFEIEIGEDWTNDPAVWVWVVVNDEAPDSTDFRNQMDGIESAIREALRKEKNPRWPYVRVRASSEQGQLLEGV